jgi:hypothetical protein
VPSGLERIGSRVQISAPAPLVLYAFRVKFPFSKRSLGLVQRRPNKRTLSRGAASPSPSARSATKRPSDPSSSRGPSTTMRSAARLPTPPRSNSHVRDWTLRTPSSAATRANLRGGSARHFWLLARA